MRKWRQKIYETEKEKDNTGKEATKKRKKIERRT